MYIHSQISLNSSNVVFTMKFKGNYGKSFDENRTFLQNIFCSFAIICCTIFKKNVDTMFAVFDIENLCNKILNFAKTLQIKIYHFQIFIVFEIVRIYSFQKCKTSLGYKIF